MLEFTTVVGVDKKHLQQLSWTLPTWLRHKSEIRNSPLVVFFDQSEVGINDVRRVANLHRNATVIPWPQGKVEYEGDPNSKFHHPQRYKMLAGFVHIPARVVQTPYWLKLDTDVVAFPSRSWIDESWFATNPSIVAQAWGMTKPANQMELLDAWVSKYKDDKTKMFAGTTEPLDLFPSKPGADKLRHKRIISWCAFFSTVFTRYSSQIAEETCGNGKLPVPSQDGFLWYCAKRLNHDIVRVQMKTRGWEWWSTRTNIRNAVHRSLNGE